MGECSERFLHRRSCARAGDGTRRDSKSHTRHPEKPNPKAQPLSALPLLSRNDTHDVSNPVGKVEKGGCIIKGLVMIVEVVGG